VIVEDEAGATRSFPTAWTNVAPVDPFVVLSQGRSLWRIEELLELVALVHGDRDDV
jgi:hypothetical protein